MRSVRLNSFTFKAAATFLAFLAFAVSADAQGTGSRQALLGSRTAVNGFRAEKEVQAKFTDWRRDPSAQQWLALMGYRTSAVRDVTVVRPAGEKADLQIRITTDQGTFREGISLKLVSGRRGYNQIDKRRLQVYVRMWEIPDDVARALRLFVGEIPPPGPSRTDVRMFLDELPTELQQRVLTFVRDNRRRIVNDLMKGSGLFEADWILVVHKNKDVLEWRLTRIDKAIEFFSAGDVRITREGNLRIGRITMQRKGGDAGRETAKMLQFKIDPLELFDQAAK